MGWSLGYDSNWERDIGYGVPAYCDHPECNEEINRGLSYVCGGEPYGGDRGCGLYFCVHHLHLHARLPQLCERCSPRVRKPFKPTPDHPDWIKWKLTDISWQKWRDENPEKIKSLQEQLGNPWRKCRRKIKRRIKGVWIMKWIGKEVLSARKIRISCWHQWFAWHPVLVDIVTINKKKKYIKVWLKTVWRRGEYVHMWYKHGFEWEYAESYEKAKDRVTWNTATRDTLVQ